MSTQYNDIEYFNEWKRTGSTEAENKFFNSIKNIIHNEVNKINKSKSVSNDTLYYKGVALVRKGIKDWDPKKSKINTYVTTLMKPLNREVYKSLYLHVPEGRIQTFQKINKVLPDYEEEHGSIN